MAYDRINADICLNQAAMVYRGDYRTVGVSLRSSCVSNGGADIRLVKAAIRAAAGTWFD